MAKPKGGLTRWFKNWVDISRPKKKGRYQPCGRKKQELHEEDTLNVSLLAWQQRCQQQRKGRLFAVKEVKHKALVVNLLMYVLLLKENVEKAAEERQVNEKRKYY